VEEKRDEMEYNDKGMLQMINKMVEEEEKLKHNIDKIPDGDCYDPDDNSYLKRVPNLQEPAKEDS
jgi:hypothetical protein